jgi:hypothetical protein
MASAAAAAAEDDAILPNVLMHAADIVVQLRYERPKELCMVILPLRKSHPALDGGGACTPEKVNTACGHYGKWTNKAAFRNGAWASSNESFASCLFLLRANVLWP